MPASMASGPTLRVELRDQAEPLASKRSAHAVPPRAELSAANARSRAPHLREHISNYAMLRGMKVVVSGASGLIGSALVPVMEASGHSVERLSRQAPDMHRFASIFWDPEAGTLNTESLEGCDAVVHLSGENIVATRWTSAFKKKIRNSRVRSTHLIADSLARLHRPPSVLICASTAGIYGDRGDEVLTEDSAPGNGFLAELACAWEAAADPARAAGIRVVHLRFGVVASPKGGALKHVLPLFRAGLGGPLGNGKQWWPWVMIDDVVGVIQFAMSRPDIWGPVNAVAPQLVTNAEFAQILGQVLRRPVLSHTPTWALRIVLGELADRALLASARVEPMKLCKLGYPFMFADLVSALKKSTTPVP
jgi:uncharacterized protein (TIGR01777 family)